MSEVPITYTTYAISSIKQLFYLFQLLYIFILISYLVQYWRLPAEFLFVSASDS